MVLTPPLSLGFFQSTKTGHPEETQSPFGYLWETQFRTPELPDKRVDVLMPGSEFR